MTQREIDILDMQCWVFRLAQRKWGLSGADCARLFEKNDIFGFIAATYDLLHLSGYESVLGDVEDYLARRGVAV